MQYRTGWIIPIVIIGLSTVAHAQHAGDGTEAGDRDGSGCVVDETEYEQNWNNMERGEARIAALCGDDDVCLEDFASFANSLMTPLDLQWMQQDACMATSDSEVLLEDLSFFDHAGVLMELPSCYASSSAWCSEAFPESIDGDDCQIDMVGEAPFLWPNQQPQVTCEQLYQGSELIGMELENLLADWNPTIFGDPFVPEGELHHDTESRFGRYFDNISEELQITTEIVSMTLTGTALLDDIVLGDLIVPAEKPTPEAIVVELGLDPTIIQPWVALCAITVPECPTDADCEEIREQLRAKQAALAAIDCGDLAAALAAAQADLVAAQADLATAAAALGVAETAFDTAKNAWDAARTQAQTAADAITDLVNNHIFHSGISTDGAGGAHRNMIGQSAGGIGYEIYFDGSQSSINTLLWLFDTPAFRAAQRQLRDAGKAMRTAEADLNQATADMITAMLDWMDAGDAVDAAQARVDALQAALDACLARQRAAQDDVQDCQEALDECLGHQSTATNAAQGTAGTAVSGADDEMDEAEERGDDTSAGRARLDEAEDKLEESEEAEDEGRHDDAQRLAREAEEIANGVKTDWERENEFWATHDPCDEVGATREEMTSEYCAWDAGEPHLVPLGHTPTSYAALGTVRKIISVIGYAVSGSDPVNDTVDNIMALTTISRVKELYAFYYGSYAREYTSYECISDDAGHVYWVERGTRTDRGELPECGLRLTSDLNDILDLSLQQTEEDVEQAVRDYLNRCRPTGCECTVAVGCN